MINKRTKIDILTRIKMSLGMDTPADEIDMQLREMKKTRDEVAIDNERTTENISIISSIIVNIDKIYELAKNDIIQGQAESFSSQIMSYQLSIERAKRQREDIGKIVLMKQQLQEKIKNNIIAYINSIINKDKYLEGNALNIRLLIQNVSVNVDRLKINNLDSNISNYNDLEKIREILLKKISPLNAQQQNNSKKARELQRGISAIESSEEKRLADLAHKQASKRKR